MNPPQRITMDLLPVPTNEAEMNVMYHKIEKLDADLKKREMHLAELIDEVVYAEGQKDQAVRRAEAGRYLVIQLECVVQDMLGYVKVLEGNVLLPAFLALSSVVPQDPLVNRKLIAEALDRISEDSLTSRTKKLIHSAKTLPTETQNRVAREAFMRSATEEPVNVEDAVVLSGLLLEKKEELTALLDDLRERIQRLLHGNKSEWPSDSGTGSAQGTLVKQSGATEMGADEHTRRVAQLEREAQLSRAQMDRLAAEHSAERAALEASAADARAQSAILEAERKEMCDRLEEAKGRTAALQRANDALRRELFDLQQERLSSSSTAAAAAAAARAGAAPALDAAVSGMAAELAEVERRMAELAGRFQEERGRIIAQFDEERARFKEERRECDTLVERMAVEIEQLAMENKSLRATAALREL